MSRSSRARGLKQYMLNIDQQPNQSRSSRARGLKPFPFAPKIEVETSRSSRARGLKHECPARDALERWSRSSRARGLKLALWCNPRLYFLVALFTGAWIETPHAPKIFA